MRVLPVHQAMAIGVLIGFSCRKIFNLFELNTSARLIVVYLYGTFLYFFADVPFFVIGRFFYEFLILLLKKTFRYMSDRAGEIEKGKIVI